MVLRKANNCQPNFRKSVAPDPTQSCGPYKPVMAEAVAAQPASPATAAQGPALGSAAGPASSAP